MLFFQILPYVRTYIPEVIRFPLGRALEMPVGPFDWQWWWGSGFSCYLSNKTSNIIASRSLLEQTFFKATNCFIYLRKIVLCRIYLIFPCQSTCLRHVPPKRYQQYPIQKVSQCVTGSNSSLPCVVRSYFYFIFAIINRL